MAEPKHPVLPYVGNYDVFVSFRGADTRSGFISHLYHGLKDAWIHVFLDNEELTYGMRLAEELPRAIDNSKIYIPVLSKTYASSKWCLRELSRMVENKKESDQANEILPVFYRVTSDDVKLKSELFKKQLSNHREKESDEVVEKWTNALKCIPEHRGWEVAIDSSKGDAKFCREIIKRVSIMLKVKHKQVPEGLVGMEDPTDDLIRLLDIGSPDLQVIGIHGMGGIGKTTLAKVVYNKLCDSFDCCSFLYDVRETLDKDKGMRGCLELQKKLLNDICRQEVVNDIRDVDDAVSIIRRKLNGKMVLMVFDDVSEPNQILRLIGNSYSLFNGESRIIITTRDRRVLQIKGFKIKIHEMEELNKQYALKLFSWHAFGRSCPPYEYSLLSDNVLDLTAGLPLSLEVIGSLLFREGKEKWKYIIQRLKTIPNKEVQERLKISYENLSEEAKEIFLDVACFFVDEERTYEIYMWEACGFFPQLGIDELLSMCLIKIKKDRYWMHDHIKDLGRQIIRQQGQEDQQQCTRFWLKEDAINILSIRKKEDNNIKVIRMRDLEYSDIGEEVWTLRPENFTNLVKLRSLQLENRYIRLQPITHKCGKLKFEGTFDNLFPNLRWLSWHHMLSEQFNVTKFNLNKLIILDLSRSNFTESWGGWKQIQGLHSLEVLDLTGCLYLRRTPDLSQYTSLKRLILNRCWNLQEIDCSIIHLKALKYLHCTKCVSLKRLPEEVFTLVHLEEIIVDFYNAETIPKIPESVGDLTSVVTLTLYNLQMITLPNSIGKLVHLEVLNLKFNGKLQSLPDSIGGLLKLEHLLLGHCTGLINLPDSLVRLPKLQILDLSHCIKLKNLSDAVGELVLLKEVSFSGLKKLPRFITMQKKLERIHAYKINFEAVPTEIEKLSSLRILILTNSRICGLPSLIQLHCLEELNLDDCIGLDQLPELPTSLVKLSVTRVSLLSIPDLSGLTSLTKLKLELKVRENDLSALTGLRCFSISSIRMLSKLKRLNLNLQGFTITEPNQLVNLTKLEQLTLLCSEMDKCVVSFPSRLRELILSLNKGTTSVSLTRLNRLEHLELSDCGDLIQILGIGELESLKYLEITSCNSYERLDDISKLRHLRSLEIRKCKKLTDINRCLNKRSLRYLEIQDCPFLENKVVGVRFLHPYIKLSKVTIARQQMNDRKLPIVDNASSCPSPSTLPESFPLPTINDEAKLSESRCDSENQLAQTSSDEVAERTTTNHMEIKGFCMDMSTFSTDDPSLDTDDLAIHEQLVSFLDDDDVIPLTTSPPPTVNDDTKEAKLVLKHFLSGGIKTLEDDSFDLSAVLAAAKTLSVINSSTSIIWDEFSSKIQVASSSYNLNLQTIQVAKDVHQRFAELKQSAKETATRFEVVKNETDHVKASKELIHSEIVALRAQFVELEKKAAEIDEKLHDAASKRERVAYEMKGQVRALKATQDEIRSKDAERTTSEAWLSSLQADWNGWRAHLDSNGKINGLSQAVWNPVCLSEQEPTDGLVRGVEVNRIPTSVDYVDDGTAHSSLNNAVSSFQMEFGISSVSGGRSKRDLEETDALKEGSRGGNDDVDNGSSRKKLRLL